MHFYVDKTFSSSQKRLLKESVKKYYFKRDKTIIPHCAMKDATRNFLPLGTSKASAKQTLKTLTRGAGTGNQGKSPMPKHM